MILTSKTVCAFNATFKSVGSLLKGASSFGKKIGVAVLAVTSMALVSCDSDGGSIPSSGSSSAGAPASIMGRTIFIDMQQASTIQGQPCLVDGRYTFVNANTVNGVGGFDLNTTSWNYTASGGQARIILNYQGGSSETYQLNFSTPTSGTFTLVADVVAFKCNGSGTFNIQ